MSGCQPCVWPPCTPPYPAQFTPTGLTGIVASSVSSAIALPSTGTGLSLVVMNAGPQIAYVAVGNSAIVATPAGTPIIPGGLVSIPQGFASNLAAITIAGSASLTIQNGVGFAQITFPAFGFGGLTGIFQNDFWDNGGALSLRNPAALPESPSSLPAGSFWSNGGEVAVVPGVSPVPGIALFFQYTSLAQLILPGAAALPVLNPGIGTKQLWNDGNVVAVA